MVEAYGPTCMFPWPPKRLTSCVASCGRASHGTTFDVCHRRRYPCHVWYLADDPRLSASAARALDDATRSGDPILVPSITLVELTYLVEKDRMASWILASASCSLAPCDQHPVRPGQETLWPSRVGINATGSFITARYTSFKGSIHRRDAEGA